MTYNTMKDAVHDMFFNQVVGVKPKKIKPTDTLMTLAPDKKFAEDFVSLYLDRTEMVFNVSIRRLKNKPLLEILNHLIHMKNNHAKYGQFKRK